MQEPPVHVTYWIKYLLFMNGRLATFQREDYDG